MQKASPRGSLPLARRVRTELSVSAVGKIAELTELSLLSSQVGVSNQSQGDASQRTLGPDP